MRSSFKTIFPAILIALFLSACTLQKRHYTGGYYFARAGHGASPAAHPRPGKATEQKVLSTAMQVTDNEKGPAMEELVSGAGKGAELIFTSKKRPLVTQDSCDLMFMRNGEEHRVRVMEVGPREIRYRRCDMPDGPLFAVYRKDVFMIKYANGTKDVIEIPAAAEPTVAVAPSGGRSAVRTTKMADLAALSFIVALIAMFVPIYYGMAAAGIAVVLGVMGLVTIRGDKSRLHGEGLAWAGLVLGLVTLSIKFLIYFY